VERACETAAAAAALGGCRACSPGGRSAERAKKKHTCILFLRDAAVVVRYVRTTDPFGERTTGGREEARRHSSKFRRRRRRTFRISRQYYRARYKFVTVHRADCPLNGIP